MDTWVMSLRMDLSIAKQTGNASERISLDSADIDVINTFIFRRYKTFYYVATPALKVFFTYSYRIPNRDIY